MKEKISLTQVTMLIVLSRVSLTLVYFGTPPVVAQDVWWQSFFAALLGIGFVWLLNLLWQRYPDRTFLQATASALGKPLGMLISLLYMAFFILLLGLNLRLIGEFFLYAFLPRTPIIVVIGVIAALAAWASRDGVEVIARAGQMVFALLIGSILLIILLLVKDIRWAFLLPLRILTTGPVPHLQDMVSVSARTVEFVWLGLLVPFLDKPKGLFGAAARAQLQQGIIWVIMNITIFGLLGREIDSYYFPFFAVARLVSVADFLERIDAIFLAVWLFGMVLRSAMLLWSASQSAADLFGLRDHRPLVIPIAGIAATQSIALAETFSEIQQYLAPEVFTPFMLTFVLGIPMLVLVVSAIRGQRSRAKPQPSSVNQ